MHRRDPVEVGDHLGGTQFPQSRAAGGGSHVRHDVRTGEGGELHREPADAAGRPGHQHPPAQHRPEPPHRPQRGDARGRQGRRDDEVDPVGYDAEVGGRDRPPSGQRAAHGEGGDPGSRGWSGTVGRGLDDDARGVLTRHAADPVHRLAVREVEEVERRRGHRDQRLVGTG